MPFLSLFKSAHLPPLTKGGGADFPLFQRGKIAWTLSLCLLLGCTTSHRDLSYFHPAVEGRDTASLLQRVREIEEEDFENIRAVTLAQNELSSHHLVVIRKEEPLHTHAEHDGWALVIQGRGEFWLGEQRFDLKPGASFFVPRGTPHQAISQGRRPLAAFVIFTPPYDGKDFVPAEEAQ